MKILVNSKKILSLIVAFCMCVTSVQLFVFADDAAVGSGVSSVETDAYYAQQVELFKALGMLSDEIPADDKPVSRGEFVRYIVRLMSGGNLAAKSGNVFWDVAKDNEYYDYICAGIAYGIINGNSDGSFNPYAYIMSEDAVRIILNSLGYGSYIRLTGNTTAAVFKTASKVDLSAAVKSGEPLVFKDMVELIYNSLDVEMLENSVIGSDTTSFETSGRTLLETYRDITAVSGVVTANSITSIDGGAFSEGQIRVGLQQINNADTKANECLGYNVDCYAKKNGGVYSYIYAVKNLDNEVLEITAEDVSNVTSSQLSYYAGAKTKTVKLNVDTLYVYNGVSVDFSKHSIKDLFAADYGKVTFVNNDGSADYDIALIEAYDTLVLTFADLEDEKLYDKLSVNNNVDLSSFDSYEIYDASGNAIVDIKENSILTAMKSLDGEYIKIIAANNSIEGTIEEVNSEGEALIGGVEYSITKELETYADNGLIAPGTSGVMYLDINGRIAYIGQSDDTDDPVAYCVGVKTQGVLGGNVQMKLFTREGEYEIFDVAGSVKIDGDTLRDSSDIISAMKAGKSEFSPIPIAYRLDADGKIKHIDTPVKGSTEDDNTLCERHLGERDGMLMYKGSSNVNYRRVFGGKYISGNDSFLVIIDDTNNYDDLDLLLSAEDDENYSVDVYSFGSDTPFGDIVLLRGNASSAVTNDVYIFKSMSNVTDETEEHSSLLKIKCYNKNAEVSLTVAYGSENIAKGTGMISANSQTNMTADEIKTCAGLKAGDLFRVGYDSKGKVTIIEKLYDYENKLFLNPVANAGVPNQNSSWEGNSSCRLVVGNVYSMTKGYARFSTSDIDLNDSGLEDKLESIYAAGYMYEVDDRGNIEFTQITTGEQILGKKNGEDIKIFARTEYTRPNMILFIK